MNKDWFSLIEKHTIPGARDKFESICSSLFKALYPNRNVRCVRVNKGDGGIDVFVGKIGLEPIKVIQCKFFPDKNIGDAQYQQIRKSFKTAINNDKYEISDWTLCVFSQLDINENVWWVNWKEKTIKNNGFKEDFIDLIDGDDLVNLLKKNNLYNIAFDKLDSIKIDEIHKAIIGYSLTFSDIEDNIIKASSFLRRLKNYFEKNEKTHLVRKETNVIFEWIKNDLALDQKNILVLEGDKGMGKSVILKDLYQSLIKDDILVLGIKSDKYYASSLKELQNLLFINEKVTFSEILKFIKKKDKLLVVVIDQLDALSQTLSSNRQYLQTYNHLISALEDEKNIRIIISSRTFDLNNDADLNIYRSSKYKSIKSTFLTKQEVSHVLGKFNIPIPSEKVLELLKIPNHLEIFCKLPNKEKINMDSLSTLNDLFNKLWKELIEKNNTMDLKRPLFIVAEKMNQKQHISIKSELINGYNKELDYLFSNELLVSDGKEIQFFHQTFYEYCFARQFVEQKKDIKSYLKQNSQNLEIRSILKMVFEYLREYNPKEYISISSNFLKSNRYRFHLKLLIIKNLSLVSSPTEDEKRLYENQIKTNSTYKEVFVTSLYSVGWMKYLIKKDIAYQYLILGKEYSETKIEYSKHIIWTLLRKNIDFAPLEVIKNLEGLPFFQNKSDFINDMISRIENWNDKELLIYFEKYFIDNKEIQNKWNYGLYKTLGSLFNYHEDYVFKITEPYLYKILTDKEASWTKVNFEHYQEDLLKQMYQVSPNYTFDFVFKLFYKVISQNKGSITSDSNSIKYYSCTKFIGKGSKENNSAPGVLEDLMLNHLIDKVENKVFVQKLFSINKHSNSADIILIFIKVFKSDTLFYKSKILELLNIIYSKKGFNGRNGEFQFNLQQLIGNSFGLFTQIEKNDLVQKIISVKHPDDSNRYFYGKNIYRYILHIDKNEVHKNAVLKTKYQELKRKFGELEINKLSNINEVQVYTVGSPYEKSSYDNMNLDNWKSSILKYNDNYEPEFHKGDVSQHSGEFKEQVKKNPDKFHQFILELFDDSKVSNRYILYGIDGLTEVNYNPHKVRELISKFISLKHNKNLSYNTLSKIDYLIKNKIVNEDIMGFLCSNALNSKLDKNIKELDYRNYARDTIRGSAIEHVIRCYQQEEFKELIFETVESAVSDGKVFIKIAVLYSLPFLNNVDIERSYKIFKKTTNTNDINILKSSVRASNYFNNKYHSEMKSYFNKIIENKDLHENGQVIVFSWILDKISDKRLFRKFVNASDSAKLCAVKAVEDSLIQDNTVNKKVLSILEKFVRINNKDFSDLYSGIILRQIEPTFFKECLPFLIKYSKSKNCIDQPAYFLQLILKSVKDYPNECLMLIKNMDFSKAPDEAKRGFYSNEPISVILAIYSKFNLDLKKNKRKVKQSLDIFDTMLRYNHLRIKAYDEIEKIK